MALAEHLESSNLPVTTDQHFVPLDRRVDVEYLGRGEAADVWRIVDSTSLSSGFASHSRGTVHKVLRVGAMSHEIAVFGTELHSDIWQNFLKEYHAQVNRWKALHHENLVQVIGLGDGLNLEVEFCEQGSVREYLERKSDHYPKKHHIIAHVLSGLNFMHTLDSPVVHGNLNAGKLFIDAKGITKIGEFGLAALCHPFAALVPSVSLVGLSRWFSPEMLIAGTEGALQPTTASDIWALGCTLYEIIVGSIPYSSCKHDMQVRRSIRRGNHPGECSSQFKENPFKHIWPLLIECWKMSPRERPAISSILARVVEGFQGLGYAIEGQPTQLQGSLFGSENALHQLVDQASPDTGGITGGGEETVLALLDKPAHTLSHPNFSYLDWPSSSDRRHRRYGEQAVPLGSDGRPRQAESNYGPGISFGSRYERLDKKLGPSVSYVGDTFRFRAADGGGNNLLLPDLGRAGTAYSRSVPHTHPLPPSELPDPELIFECLLERDKQTPHPAGLSTLFFSFALTVFHTVFRTNHRDVTINETSSYVDLAPLYGNNQQEQDSVRRCDGTGRLKDDVFTENRLLFMPPAVCTILILFCRNHNYIVRKLFLINEEGNYQDPERLNEEQRRQQDHTLFNIARLINVGFYCSIVLGDYMAGILGTVADGSDWSLNPFQDIIQSERNHISRGDGSSASVEFNLLYHWHSTTSAIDEKWTEGVFRKIFGDKKFEDITPAEFGRASAYIANAEKDNTKWEFGGMKRGEDGKFNDTELTQILVNATSHVASAFKARGTPPVLRVIEILGILNSRKWGVCSLNQFRKFIGLKPYHTFEDWNSDPEIANAAMRLYKHPDNLELYVGLQAEEAKPIVAGARLCTGYTISRAILSHVICLTRGDRYLTTDWTTKNLTCWGFHEVTRDTNNPSFGGMLGKLFHRTLPNQFPENSIYLWFPLMTPQAMKENFTRLGIAGDYDFSKPVGPRSVRSVDGRQEVIGVFSDVGCIHTPYGKKVEALVGKESGFFVALNDEQDHAYKQIIHECLVEPSGTYFQSYFYESTKSVLQEMSYTLANHQSKCLNIVEVFDTVIIRFVSDEVGGLSIKSPTNPRGVYFEQEMKGMLEEIYLHVFNDIDIQDIFRIAKNAKTNYSKILDMVQDTYAGANGIGSIGERFYEWFTSKDVPCYDFMRRLQKTDKSKDQLCNAVLAAIVVSLEYIPALTNVINFYLGPANAEHKAQLVALASSKDPNADLVIAGYVREALRLDPLFSHVRRIVVETTTIPGSNFKRGDSLLLAIADANLDPEVFPDPMSVNPRRPFQSYTLMGDGLHRCYSDEFVHLTMARVIRAVFQLKNIRRGPGRSGLLNRFQGLDGNTTAKSQYLNSKLAITSFPTTLTLQYDA